MRALVKTLRDCDSVGRAAPLARAADVIEKQDRIISASKRDAAIVTKMLELGDYRLLACDGPAGGQLPDLSPKEWGKVYRACKRIGNRLK